ncbi:hypothetical protein AB4Z54_39690, partial [Streptomyces sp. MCAF7]
MADGTQVREDELSSYALTTIDGQRLTGRAYLSAQDVARWENGMRQLSAVEYYTDLYVGQSENDPERVSGLRPLPRNLTDAYIAVGHGDGGIPGLPVRSSGQTHRAGGEQLGRLISRRKSLQQMPPENPVWILWCELGQVRPGDDRLVSPPVAQYVSNSTGRQGFTSEARQGWQAPAEGVRLIKYDDPDQPQFRYREFRPEPSTGTLADLADLAGLPADTHRRTTRALRWVRSLRETHGVDIDTNPGRVAEFQNLIRGFGALESLRMNAPGNPDTGPLTWRSLEQIVGGYAQS